MACCLESGAPANVLTTLGKNFVSLGSIGV